MYRALIVDDEEIIRTGIKNLLDWKDFGFEEIHTASSALEALQMMKQTSYDLLLTDIRMPVMTGLELIAEARQDYPHLKIAIISGYNDFEYMKQAFPYGIENYILKPIDAEELQSTLTIVMDKLDHEYKQTQLRQMMNSMLLDNVLLSWIMMSQGEPALQERLELFHVKLSCSHYTVAIIRLLKLNQSAAVEQMSIEYLRSAFQKSCHEGETLYLTVNLSNDILVVLGSDSPSSPTRLQELLQQEMDEWGACDKNWFAAVGAAVDHPMRVHQSFCSAEALLLYSCFPEESQVQVVSIQEKRITALLELLDTSEKALQEIVFSPLEEATATISSHLQRLASSASYTALMDFIYLLLSESNKLQRLVQAKDSIPLDFSLLLDRKSFTASCTQCLQLLTAYVEQHSNSNTMNPMIMRVLDYIQTNFSENMSLKTLSQQFNISQIYLGRLFKSETGFLFTEYLSNFRLEKAKELLANTDMKSNDIAFEIGFNNSNYFANVFKKRVGVYPTKYRKLMQNNTTDHT